MHSLVHTFANLDKIWTFFSTIKSWSCHVSDTESGTRSIRCTPVRPVSDNAWQRYWKKSYLFSLYVNWVHVIIYLGVSFQILKTRVFTNYFIGTDVLNFSSQKKSGIKTMVVYKHFQIYFSYISWLSVLLVQDIKIHDN